MLLTILRSRCVAHGRSPIRPGTPMRQAASDGYYEEAREGQIIPEGSRAQPGTPICVGPGLCQLRRTPCMRTSENAQNANFAVTEFLEIRCIADSPSRASLGYPVRTWT